MVLVAPQGKGWAEPGRIDCEFGTVPLCDLANREPFREVTDRDGRTQAWAVARSPSVRDAGLYILVGRSKDGLVAAANRRLYEDLAILAVASLLLLAGVWLLATMSVGRQVGRLAAMATKLGLGDLSARIAPPHPRGELGGLMTLLNGTAESLERQRAAIDELNQKLTQSQKMEAMGQLTGGVAHDFNNLLTVILGNAEHLAEKLVAHKELHHIAESIATAAERGSDLTRSLLAFARKQPLMPRDIDIGQKIVGMEQLLRRTLGEHIECEFRLEQNLWQSSVDPGQLASALLNLVLNARDAMPSGGTLMVEVQNTSLGKSDVDVNGQARPGDYVMVAVTDTGTGMTAEVAGRAFEPFFTTKEVGKGTGLGLSMVYGFVQQSGGSMQIHSEPGQGTVVRLFFPRVAAPPSERRAIGRSASPRPPAARPFSLSRTTTWCGRYVEGELKALGYRVIVTRNGPAALEVLRGPERNRPAVHRCRDARRHVRAPSLPGKPPACGPRSRCSSPPATPNIRSRRPTKSAPGADPEQAVPPARSGVDVAIGSEGGLIGYEDGTITVSGARARRRSAAKLATNKAASMTKILSIGPFNTGQYATPTRPPRIRTGRL